MDPNPQDPQDLASNTPPAAGQPATPAPAPAAAAAPLSPAPAPVQTGAGAIDLDKILLPKKEAPGTSPQSAQRVNAAALLEQELNATLLTPKEAAPAQPAVPAQEKPAQEKPATPALETFRGDIEAAVRDKGISMLSIATAEAERREQQPAPVSEETRAERGEMLTKLAMSVGGVVLLLLAAAVSFLVYERFAAVAVVPIAQAPFITVDNTRAVPLPPGLATRDATMAALVSAKMQTNLSLGLVERLFPLAATSSTAAPQEVSAQTLLSILAPDVPPTLLRTLGPTYLLGVHSFDGNQPFFMFSVDSYEAGYAGMLSWETGMQGDLAPLFTYTPPAHIPEENIVSVPPPTFATTTATSTATTTPQSASSTPTAPLGTALLVSPFVDQVVENHDARVILNKDGDIVFLWAFLDPKTLVITTNQYTLRELISRRAEAPLNALPQ